MGFIADSLTFSDITVLSPYCTIGGCCEIAKNATIYTVSYTFKISKNKGGNPLLIQSTGVCVQELPTDIWTLIYSDVKKKLDPNGVIKFIDCYLVYSNKFNEKCWTRRTCSTKF